MEMPASNVRVLNAGDNRDRGVRPTPAADRMNNDRGNDRVGSEVVRRPPGTPQQHPAVTRVTAGMPSPATREDIHPEVRGNTGLPSARFAHPRSRDNIDQRESTPRPGVSYISGASENQPRPAYRNNPSLPQVPRIQRADQNPGNRNVPPIDERSQRYPSNRATRQDLPTPAAPMRNGEEPRFQRAEPTRAEPTPRSYIREPQPRPESARNEPLRRPAFQPPQQLQQPRYEPRPRAEAPQPQRVESRPPPQRNPHRPKDDTGQH
jgi:hypothetical protein